MLSIGLLFTSCNYNNKEVNVFIGNGIIVIDSASTGIELVTITGNNKQISSYPVYYIGPKADTISLGRKPISMFADEKNDLKYRAAKNWNSIKSMELSIYVDTTMHLSNNIDFTHFDNEDADKEILDSIRFYKAFPVFIENQSDSLISVGTHNFVNYLTREVRDENGNWIEIESADRGALDGTAKRHLVIEPNHILIAKMSRYKGDMRAECRLKFNISWEGANEYVTYSNVFIDNIMKEQLKALQAERTE